MKNPSGGWLLGAAIGGVALAGGALLLAAWPKAQHLPSSDWPVGNDYTQADVEAAARMLASENAAGGQQLHAELIASQMRMRKPGQALFDRLTAGSGYGPQGERSRSGGVRPVATDTPATDALRKRARAILDGEIPSVLPGARKFFEPKQQDLAFAIAEQARRKQASGQLLTRQEQRLIRYLSTARQIRARWIQEGARLVGIVEGVEFYT